MRSGPVRRRRPLGGGGLCLWIWTDGRRTSRRRRRDELGARRRSPASEEVVEDDARGDGVERIAGAGRAERLGLLRREALVPEPHGRAVEVPVGDVGEDAREVSREVGLRALGTGVVERKADDEAGRALGARDGEEVARHGGFVAVLVVEDAQRAARPAGADADADALEAVVDRDRSLSRRRLGRRERRRGGGEPDVAKHTPHPERRRGGPSPPQGRP
mmetsp:Transcript_26929/g.107777  ORF Transcript_26929/g.107777 Transcript_26929/m.107777 type:complete len:218 (-) Transcript_26929:55-708(-)